jgi:hypothetical protein
LPSIASSRRYRQIHRYYGVIVHEVEEEDLEVAEREYWGLL